MSVLFILAWIFAIGLVCVGLYSLLAPRLLAGHYGVAVEHHSGEGYVRATGVRDVALGVILGAIAYTHSRSLLIVFAVVAIVISVVDLVLVRNHGGHHRMHPSHAIHAGGIVAFILILTMALFAIGL
ncbi:MAG TPA: DUF4267 domain-containing protein [Candidatus Baltobacteraceae bacterium]|jgi:hypothetical protein|nr:DUF4267 domain-containing protein [Candidatus Baltobacteraceae bacterium]